MTLYDIARQASRARNAAGSSSLERELTAIMLSALDGGATAEHVRKLLHLTYLVLPRTEEVTPQKRKRGRPRKVLIEAKRKRGRPIGRTINRNEKRLLDAEEIVRRERRGEFTDKQLRAATLRMAEAKGLMSANEDKSTFSKRLKRQEKEIKRLNSENGKRAVIDALLISEGNTQPDRTENPQK
ncbi:MAG: hypothetical protein ACK52I_19430 [Pseudomonadota bacterium]